MIKRISCVVERILSNAKSESNQGFRLESMEGRQMLSADVSQLILPAASYSNGVKAVGVTIQATAGQPFTGVIGNVTGLRASVLKNLNGLQASTDWGDGAFPVSSPVTLSVSNGVLIVTGTHTYAYSGNYSFAVPVTTLPNKKGIVTFIADISSNAVVPTPVTADYVVKAGQPVNVDFGTIPFSVGPGYTFQLFSSVNWDEPNGLVGGSSTVTQIGNTGVYDLSGTYTYTKPGYYNVTGYITYNVVLASAGFSHGGIAARFTKTILVV